MSVKYLKLVNELDLVAEVPDIQDGDEWLKLIKPAVIVMVNARDGKKAVTLQPYMMFTNETEFHYLRSNITVITEIDPKIAALYDKMYGTGIELPSKELILP